jgi:hypothetical protein
MHFLDLSDDFFTELFEFLFTKPKNERNRQDYLKTLLLCFNRRLIHKIFNLTQTMVVGNVVIFNKMLKLRNVTFDIIPTFFPQTLYKLILNVHHRIIEEHLVRVIPNTLTRTSFQSFPPNLTYLKTKLLFASEFAILPKSLTYLNVGDIKLDSVINFDLPQLLYCKIAGPNNRFVYVDKIKVGQAGANIVGCLSVALKKLDLSNFDGLTIVPSMIPHNLEKLRLYNVGITESFDLMFLPPTLKSINIESSRIAGYDGTRKQCMDTLLKHLNHFPLMRTFEFGVNITKFPQNIFDMLPEHLTKFSFMEDHQDSGYLENKIYIKVDGEWHDEFEMDMC